MILLCQHVSHNIPCDVCQTVVATGMAVRQTRVIDTKQMQDGRVEVMDMDAILGDDRADFVRRAVTRASFHTPTGQP